MHAMVYTRYGTPDVLHLEEVAKPIPGDDEARIQVQAASVNRSDWEGLTGTPLYARIGGLRRPRQHILGSDVAGRVESVGRNIKQLGPGDEVFGLLFDYGGGFAEYVCAPERAWARKPAGLTFEEAATIPQAAVIALRGIRDQGQVRPGQQVLINGAGGGAGSFAIQLAKSYGAEVTGVDHTSKLDFMRSLGADHVVDYTQSDFTRSGQAYDMILDVIARRSVFAYLRALKPHGKGFVVGGSVATMFQCLLLGPWIRRATGKTLAVLAVRPKATDMHHIAELYAAGVLVSVIDRRYPLREVPEALRYLGEGRVRGKVVITIGTP